MTVVVDFPNKASPRNDWTRAYNELRQWHFKHKWGVSAHERQAMLRALMIEIDLCEEPAGPDWRQRVREFMGWKR